MGITNIWNIWRMKPEGLICSDIYLSAQADAFPNSNVSWWQVVYLHTAGRLILAITCILIFGIFDKWSLKVWFVQIPSQTPLVLVRTTLPALINHYKKIFIVLEKVFRGTKTIKLILLLEVTKLHLCDTQVSLYYLSLWRYNHILVAWVEPYYWFSSITSCVFWTSNIK